MPETPAQKARHYECLKLRRAKLYKAGLCSDCRIRPRVGTTMLCEKCKKTKAQNLKKLRAKRVAAGLCAKCGRDGLATESLCAKCHALERRHNKNLRDRRKDGGLCERCGDEMEEMSTMFPSGAGKRATVCGSCASAFVEYKERIRR